MLILYIIASASGRVLPVFPLFSLCLEENILGGWLRCLQFLGPSSEQVVIHRSFFSVPAGHLIVNGTFDFVLGVKRVEPDLHSEAVWIFIPGNRLWWSFEREGLLFTWVDRCQVSWLVWIYLVLWVVLLGGSCQDAPWAFVLVEGLCVCGGGSFLLLCSILVADELIDTTLYSWIVTTSCGPTILLRPNLLLFLLLGCRMSV